MASFKIKKHIAAPPETVFERATDLRKAPEVIRGIKALEVLTDGPIGVGTRFRETRIMFKREATEEMTITAFDPPRSYAVGAESHGCRYHTEFRFAPSRGGTDVEMEFEATPLTLWAKVLGFVFKPMMKSVVRECGKDLDDLKAAIEGSSGAPAGGTARPERGSSASSQSA